MSQPIKISQLVTMSLSGVNALSNDDFFPIVDSGSLATNRLSIENLRSFISTGSYSGSVNGTASFADSSTSASHALIANYATNTQGLYDTISGHGHGFKVGYAIRRAKLGEPSGSNGYVTCSITGDISGSEALALVVDTGSYGIRVCYQGLANFADDDASVTASYIGGGLSTGSVYFLSDGGQLTLTEPVSSSQVTKPMMVAITPSSGIIINSRGIRLAPNYTTSSNTLSGYMTAGSGSFSASLSKPPAYLRTVLICESGGDLSYNQYDEVDSQCVFATGSGGLCVPFLTTTCNVTSYTASFKHTSSWAPHMSCLSGSGATGIGKINLTKWKLKIYS